jgi:hypothetical protein
VDQAGAALTNANELLEGWKGKSNLINMMVQQAGGGGFPTPVTQDTNIFRTPYGVTLMDRTTK